MWLDDVEHQREVVEEIEQLDDPIDLPGDGDEPARDGLGEPQLAEHEPVQHRALEPSPSISVMFEMSNPRT